MLDKDNPQATPDEPEPGTDDDAPAAPAPPLEPTRYGDWEVAGRCIDF